MNKIYQIYQIFVFVILLTITTLIIYIGAILALPLIILAGAYVFYYMQQLK